MATSQWVLGSAALYALSLGGCSGGSQRCHIGSPVALGQGELTVSRVETRAAGTEMELAVFFRWTGPAKDLLRGFFAPRLKMTLADSAGTEYSPVIPKWSPMQPVPEENYNLMRNYDSWIETKGRDPSFEADLASQASRFEQLEAEVKAGRNPERWVHIFKVPLGTGGFILHVKNPDRKLGQPGQVEVSLER